jgi:hypothetical protein
VIRVNDTKTSISTQLTRLERRERAISDRRRELHQQIDMLYLEAPLDASQMAELDQLESLEQTISRQRRRLHQQVDELRRQIGLPRWREQQDLDTASVLSSGVTHSGETSTRLGKARRRHTSRMSVQ